MEKSILSKNIKKLRLFKRLNQTEFADLFELTRASIGAYEEGRAEPKLVTLMKIASHFKLTIDELIRKELTVNQIARFKEPDQNQLEIADLHAKIDLISRQLVLINKKLSKEPE
jgi:transcriptional regulator with XRE-family HTH domain